MVRNNKQEPYYKPVIGSRDIRTSADNSVAVLKRLERASPGEALEVEYDGETLHRGPVAAAFPFDLYDKSMPGLDPLEQVVLGHLVRLSAGIGQDWLRVGKKELIRRTGLSHRRLLKALAGLAEIGLIRPLHRDTNGTLYKMYTVHKQVQHAHPKPAPISREPAAANEAIIPQLREKTLESPVNEEVFPTGAKVITMKEIAKEFYSKINRRPSDAEMDSALAQITYLLEDGFTREEVRKAALFLAEAFGKKADLQKLPYYINQVIKD